MACRGSGVQIPLAPFNFSSDSNRLYFNTLIFLEIYKKNIKKNLKSYYLNPYQLFDTNKNSKKLTKGIYKFENLFLTLSYFVICFLYISWMSRNKIDKFVLLKLDYAFSNAENIVNNYFDGFLSNMFLKSSIFKI